MNFLKCDFKASYGLSSQLPSSDRPEIVFSGRSNVGKSSLINKLCNRKHLAKTSSTPGKTATINFFNCDTAYLVDLPGYGYAKVSNSDRKRWDELINSYFEEDRNNVLLLQLLDCRHSPSKDDMTMLSYLKHYNIPFIAVLTKQDKLRKSEIVERETYFLDFLKEYPSLVGVRLVSSSNGYGIAELQEQISLYADAPFTGDDI